MQSLWDDAESAQYPGDLGQRVYSSRLLGRNPALVLHGGGNTSVKMVERNLVGEDEEVLYVKGSGWDLEHIEADGFAPVRMARLLALAQLDALDDSEMVNQLRTQAAYIFFGLPADVQAAVYLHDLIALAFATETSAFQATAIYRSTHSSQRRSAANWFQVGLARGIIRKLDTLRQARDVAGGSTNGRALVPIKEAIIEDHPVNTRKFHEIWV